ncbi:MAG: methyltransferase domain-containing protein [Bryobacteraceae bacterium]|jgi:2-polyprenyl-3-methyl-5-hydroxy-6-metoxy-1,4-benzoquinol methylase
MHTTLLALLLLLQAVQAPAPVQNSGKRRTAMGALPSETPAEYWDRAYSDPSLVFNTAPNAFLTEVVKGLKPGRALDIGMGQGRNSVYLAKLGWDVTGFDISERGMELARKSAAAAGVMITTIRASMDDFDYGVGRWDLIVATYEGVSWLEAAAKGLKPGGFIVVEGYSRHPQAPAGTAYGPNELLKLFMDQNLHVVRYEDVEGEPDWLKLDRVVRMFARKPS